MSDTVSAHGDGTNVFFDPENNFAPIFLDSFKSRDYIYKGNIFEPVPPCKPCLCFVYRQFDEDLLPLWLQAKTFLLSLETVRAFLSFTNRNINLDQCQSFFPLCLQLVTHVFVFPSENSNLTKTLCLDVEVRCLWRFDATCALTVHVRFHRSLSCEDTCWADVHQPSDTSCPKPTEEKHDQYLLHVRQRTRTKTVFLFVDSTVGASFCPGVFTFDTSDKSSSDI